ELNFVYNDKGLGVTIKLEEARAELKAANPGIEFKVFTAKNLEETFFMLDAQDMMSLGFNVDSRTAVQNARTYLEKLDAEQDKELLDRAAQIDPDYWLLRLEKLIRDIRLDTEVDVSSIDEGNFPTEPRERSNFYRIYAILLWRAKDRQKADEFIERAVHFN